MRNLKDWRHIDLSDVPGRAAKAAKKKWKALESGTHHGQIGGKALQIDRDIVSIKLPGFSRLVVRNERPGYAPIDLVTHESYNKRYENYSGRRPSYLPPGEKKKGRGLSGAEIDAINAQIKKEERDVEETTEKTEVVTLKELAKETGRDQSSLWRARKRGDVTARMKKLPEKSEPVQAVARDEKLEVYLGKEKSLDASTVTEIADLLGLTRSGIYYHLDQGNLTAQGKSPKLVAHDDKLEAMLDRKAEESPKAPSPEVSSPNDESDESDDTPEDDDSVPEEEELLAQSLDLRKRRHALLAEAESLQTRITLIEKRLLSDL